MAFIANPPDGGITTETNNNVFIAKNSRWVSRKNVAQAYASINQSNKLRVNVTNAKTSSITNRMAVSLGFVLSAANNVKFNIATTSGAFTVTKANTPVGATLRQQNSVWGTPVWQDSSPGGANGFALNWGTGGWEFAGGHGGGAIITMNAIDQNWTGLQWEIIDRKNADTNVIFSKGGGRINSGIDKITEIIFHFGVNADAAACVEVS